MLVNNKYIHRRHKSLMLRAEDIVNVVFYGNCLPIYQSSIVVNLGFLTPTSSL